MRNGHVRFFDLVVKISTLPITQQAPSGRCHFFNICITKAWKDCPRNLSNSGMHAYVQYTDANNIHAHVQYTDANNMHARVQYIEANSTLIVKMIRTSSRTVPCTHTVPSSMPLPGPAAERAKQAPDPAHHCLTQPLLLQCLMGPRQVRTCEGIGGLYC